MLSRYQTDCYSFAEFVELIGEDQKADLIDGVIYLNSPESMEHSQIMFWLAMLLRRFLESRPLGAIAIKKPPIQLDELRIAEPDLAFVRADRVHLMKRGYVDGPPDLAVEVVSPDSVDRDYELKRGLYERFGVSEYWILDPDETTATFLVHQAGAYVEAALDATIFRSRVLPGLTLDTRWLWQRPLPPTLPIVQNLLR